MLWWSEIGGDIREGMEGWMGSYEVEIEVREIGRGRNGPGRGSFKKKVPEAGKTQGVFFSRHRYPNLEKTLIKKRGLTGVWSRLNGLEIYWGSNVFSST